MSFLFGNADLGPLFEARSHRLSCRLPPLQWDLPSLAQSLRRVRLSVALRTVAVEAPLSVGFQPPLYLPLYNQTFQKQVFTVKLQNCRGHQLLSYY